MDRRYEYVGPAEIRDHVRSGIGGRPITSLDDLVAWLNEQGRAEREDPFTFVIDVNGTLRVAPQRSEHVAYAGGDAVLSAGEITFSQDGGRWWSWRSVTNPRATCFVGGAPPFRAGVKPPSRGAGQG